MKKSTLFNQIKAKLRLAGPFRSPNLNGEEEHALVGSVLDLQTASAGNTTDISTLQSGLAAVVARLDALTGPVGGDGTIETEDTQAALFTYNSELDVTTIVSTYFDGDEATEDIPYWYESADLTIKAGDKITYQTINPSVLLTSGGDALATVKTGGTKLEYTHPANAEEVTVHVLTGGETTTPTENPVIRDYIATSDSVIKALSDRVKALEDAAETSSSTEETQQASSGGGGGEESPVGT